MGSLALKLIVIAGQPSVLIGSWAMVMSPLAESIFLTTPEPRCVLPAALSLAPFFSIPFISIRLIPLVWAKAGVAKIARTRESVAIVLQRFPLTDSRIGTLGQRSTRRGSRGKPAASVKS